MERKTYLADGVYVAIECGTDLVLTVENGVEVLHRIVLEPETYAALVRYVQLHLAPRKE